jgi:hypothetical protein
MMPSGHRVWRQGGAATGMTAKGTLPTWRSGGLAASYEFSERLASRKKC